MNIIKIATMPYFCCQHVGAINCEVVASRN